MREKNEKLLKEIKKWEDENDSLQKGWKADRDKLKELEAFQSQGRFERQQGKALNPNSSVESRYQSYSAQRFPWKASRREQVRRAAGQRKAVNMTASKNANVKSDLVDKWQPADQLANNRKRKCQERIEDKTNKKTLRKARYTRACYQNQFTIKDNIATALLD